MRPLFCDQREILTQGCYSRLDYLAVNVVPRWHRVRTLVK